MTAIIKFENVTKTYQVEGTKKTFNALNDISLSIDEGHIYAIIGGSGAGKSTLVRMINALERPSSGAVYVEGTDITTLKAKEVRAQRTRIGMVFQQFNLMNSRTVYDNIAFSMECADVPRDERRNRIAELLHFVGLAEKAWSYPRQLSGGQKQRVGIARALAANPKILLADEATSALDPQTTNDVLALLRRVNTEFGITVVVITHEMDVVRKIADRVAVLDKGDLVEEGDVYSIFADPQADLTQRIVANSLHAKPGPRDTALLTERYPGRLVSVAVSERHQVGRVLGDAVRDTDVTFEFVYGGIAELAGKAVGNITLAFSGTPASIDDVVTKLQAHTTVEELS